ncbi:Sodium/calcium exchanger membrane region [Parasponia andersonii]|uniref:Sodium/calcium exchanger membrane region n=1 Tax=Parasponia andersonii TaxID=3476 RepID=A0A2P5ANY7_PARAD|nr:Sodium/calcium exchanger membrane region [Parasponia andersonii]
MASSSSSSSTSVNTSPISSLILISINTIAFLFLLVVTKTQSFDHPHEYAYSSTRNHLNTIIKTDACAALHDFSDYASKCSYLKTHLLSCKPKGYINYLNLFYCHFGHFPLLGKSLLLLWLVVLLYLIGNTAAVYFCPSLESLSNILKLSPTIAGITLLSLGNGAPDVFAIVISFTKSGDADVGLNSVLGGAFFVSSVVVGVISVLIDRPRMTNATTPPPLIDKTSFVRDVAFFLFALSSLLAIFAFEKVSLFAAICFFAIYFLYVCSVSATHFFSRNDINEYKTTSVVDGTTMSSADVNYIPLLGYVDDNRDSLNDEKVEVQEQNACRMGYVDYLKLMGKLTLKLVELPLYLPRRATIPVVTEDQWSKPYAVVSVSLAPILMAALCNTQRENVDSRTELLTYMTAGLVGLVLGNLAYVTTNHYCPPKQCLFPWLVGGFVMSVTWTYLVAEELVSLLVSLGSVFGISPSVLGLTVLAWGNSLGDLIANVAMALRGGPDGAQIAISGCYAGPLFNTVVGVGFSLVMAAWTEYPSVYEIPKDHSLYETVGFLVGGLLWALVVLPKNDMRLNRLLGIGLLAIYGCFLFVRLARVLGFLGLSTPTRIWT